MRVAIANWTQRTVGGIETYLARVVPALADAGLELSFFSEGVGPSDRALIALPGPSLSWCVETMGERNALEGLRAFRPDLLYVNGIRSPELENRLDAIAARVVSVHAYVGTCISGTKMHAFPFAEPCNKIFGPACLVQYFPRRCGGMRPLRMLRDYNLQQQRLELLRSARAVVAHSVHMKTECERHGVAANVVPLPAAPSNEGARVHRLRSPDAVRLLFVGRFDRLKGGALLIESLKRVATQLCRTISVSFVGDGPEASTWRRLAKRVERDTAEIHISFQGWKSGEDLSEEIRRADLLVVPSTWPEPFGLVGPEAGLFGLPTAAFDVGGVRDWLEDGTNGHLANGSPPTARGLAEAVVACLKDDAHYASLREGARENAARFTLEATTTSLLSVLEGAVSRPPEPS